AFEKFPQRFEGRPGRRFQHAARDVHPTRHDRLRPPSGRPENIRWNKMIFEEFGKVLGIFSPDTMPGAGIDDELSVYVQEEIKRRDEAKKNKDYRLADEIRQRLLVEKGISLMDT